VLAKLSIRACARLGGYLQGNDATPDNPAVKKSLSAMLTPYLAWKLGTDSAEEVSALLL
jgi:DnaJ family protein C protein 13